MGLSSHGDMLPRFELGRGRLVTVVFVAVRQVSDEVVDDDGAGAVASFVDMDGIAPHPEGGWLVVDDCMLRRVLLDGTVSTLAGSGQAAHKDGCGRRELSPRPPV